MTIAQARQPRISVRRDAQDHQGQWEQGQQVDDQASDRVAAERLDQVVDEVGKRRERVRHAEVDERQAGHEHR